MIRINTLRHDLKPIARLVDAECMYSLSLQRSLLVVSVQPQKQKSKLHCPFAAFKGFLGISSCLRYSNFPLDCYKPGQYVSMIVLFIIYPKTLQ